MRGACDGDENRPDEIGEDSRREGQASNCRLLCKFQASTDGEDSEPTNRRDRTGTVKPT
jgi:hypothetical protein